MKTQAQAERIEKALGALHVYKFRQESSYTLNDARSNLTDRTHYVDEGTMKYFGARIGRAWIPGECTTSKGFLYAIVESLKKPGGEAGKIKRACLFDCFGEVVYQSEFQRTPDKAEKELYAFLDTFDLMAHYKERIRAVSDRMLKEAKRARAALCGRLKD